MKIFRENYPTKGTITKIIFSILFILLLGGMLFYAAVKINRDYISNWDVIQFAIQKPNLVRNLKSDFASKSAQLESSYTKKGPTAQDKLIEELTNQLQSVKK